MRQPLINPWLQSGVSGRTQVKHGVHYDVANARFVCERGVNHFCRHLSPFFTGGTHTHTAQPAGCGKHTCVPVGFEKNTPKKFQHHVNASRKNIYTTEKLNIWGKMHTCFLSVAVC